MKTILKTGYFLFSLAVCFLLSVACYYDNILPDSVTIYDNERLIFNTAFEVDEFKYEKTSTVAKSYKNAGNSYTSELKLLGFIPIKEVKVDRIKERYVSLGGQSFGIKIFTKGVMVVGMSDVNSAVGNVNPAKNAGLKIGDIILSASGEDINSNEELGRSIKQSKGNYLEFQILRNNEKSVIRFKPLFCTETNEYKAGIWVRDSTAGIGTMTFYSTVNGAFAGLGHGVMDVDTGLLLPINSGEAVKTEILSVNKGKPGTAGELCGAFTGESFGKLCVNCECGLYGFLDEFDLNAKLIKVASVQDVKTGRAKIYTTIDNGKPKYYDCVIERVDYNDDEQKNLMIRITDEKLIEKTGGIVQGMSGSPIIQNNMLVGALTNVFVNDPKKGYAVFSEEMYQKALSNIRQYGAVS